MNNIQQVMRQCENKLIMVFDDTYCNMEITVGESERVMRDKIEESQKKLLEAVIAEVDIDNLLKDISEDSGLTSAKLNSGQGIDGMSLNGYVRALEDIKQILTESIK